MMLLDRPDFAVGLGENDVLKDCTLVALINSARAAALVQKGYDLAINWDSVVSSFAKVAGVSPTLSAEKAVQGLQPRDVINYAMRYGIDAGLQAPLVLRSASSVPSDTTSVWEAIQKGAPYVELALCQHDIESAECMDAFDGKVVAMHQVIFYNCDGFDPNSIIQVGTWGRWQYMTWRGFQARLQGVWDLQWALS